MRIRSAKVNPFLIVLIMSALNLGNIRVNICWYSSLKEFILKQIKYLLVFNIELIICCSFDRDRLNCGLGGDL